MVRTSLVVAVVLLVGCGVDDSRLDSNVSLDPAVASADAVRPPIVHIAVVDTPQPFLDLMPMDLPLEARDPLAPGDDQIRQPPACTTSLISPIATGTLRQIPGLGIFEPAPVGHMVQASYFKTTSTNEEFRVGIAEFDIGPDVVSAVLRFSERRAVVSAPTPEDTYSLTLYPADLVLNLTDWKEVGADGPVFRSDANNAPATLVTFDVTKHAKALGKRVGIRFELASQPITGHGTGFDNLQLEILRCNQAAQ